MGLLTRRRKGGYDMVVKKDVGAVDIEMMAGHFLPNFN